MLVMTWLVCMPMVVIIGQYEQKKINMKKCKLEFEKGPRLLDSHIRPFKPVFEFFHALLYEPRIWVRFHFPPNLNFSFEKLILR